jgi:hypothetical protein
LLTPVNQILSCLKTGPLPIASAVRVRNFLTR